MIRSPCGRYVTCFCALCMRAFLFCAINLAAAAGRSFWLSSLLVGPVAMIVLELVAVKVLAFWWQAP